jgi:hypothetical protein
VARVLRALVVAALVLSAQGCGPSEAECRPLCDWFVKSCTETGAFDDCMDSCTGASSDAVDRAQSCTSLDLSTCQRRGCCLEFVYTASYLNQYCR